MGLGKISDVKHFNSHAHVERDQIMIKINKDKEISTHTLTWSVTHIVVNQVATLIFQLTRSRGA